MLKIKLFLYLFLLRSVTGVMSTAEKLTIQQYDTTFYKVIDNSFSLTIQYYLICISFWPRILYSFSMFKLSSVLLKHQPQILKNLNLTPTMKNLNLIKICKNQNLTQILKTQIWFKFSKINIWISLYLAAIFELLVAN